MPAPGIEADTPQPDFFRVRSSSEKPDPKFTWWWCPKASLIYPFNEYYMKKRVLYFASILLVLAVIFWPGDANVHSNSGAAPIGYTGAPNEFSGRTCGSGGGCHGGGTTFQSEWITTTIPDCGYTAGETYTINVFVTSPGRTRFGFSFSPQFVGSSQLAGTIIAGEGTQINGGGKYMSHTSAGTQQNGTNSRTWTFQWTAPAAGSGQVGLYAAMNATNSNNGTSGDIIFNSSVIVQEAQSVTATALSSTTICEGETVVLQSSTATGNVWRLNGNQVGNQQTFAAGQAGTYTLENTQNECVSTSQITVTVNSLPATPNVAANGPLTFCEGQSVTLTSTAGSATVWQPGGVTGNQITVTEAGNYTATLSNTCGESVSQAILVNVLEAPEQPVILANGSTDVCLPETVLLEVQGENVGGIWSNGEFVEVLEVNVSGSYFFTVTNLCGAANSEIIEVTISDVLAAPQVLVPEFVPFCEGDVIELNVTNPTGAMVVWGPGDITANSILVDTSGIYTAVLINACGASEAGGGVVNFVAPPEVPEIILNDDGLLECTVEGSFYTWFFNGEPLSSDEQAIIPEGIGTYNVLVFNAQGCFAENSEPFEFDPTGLDEMESREIQIYPNPAADFVKVRGAEKGQLIHLMDAQGRLVKTFESEGIFEQQFMLEAEAGLYFIGHGKYKMLFVK